MICDRHFERHNQSLGASSGQPQSDIFALGNIWRLHAAPAAPETLWWKSRPATVLATAPHLTA